jgi:thymidylate synthase ThyX
MHTAELDWITPDAERVIARHARVSTKNPDREEFKGLLKYCINHGHWSIYEQASASFEIITTRSISAQIIRHRSFAFQETSQHMSGSIRSWIHYVGLRGGVETQLEHRTIAVEIGKALEREVPSVIEAVKEQAAKEFNLKGWLFI